MMKADSRLNEKVEGSRYIGILWHKYWELCQAVSLLELKMLKLLMSLELKDLHALFVPQVFVELMYSRSAYLLFVLCNVFGFSC